LILTVGKEIWGESLNSCFGRIAVAKCLQIKRGQCFFFGRTLLYKRREMLFACVHSLGKICALFTVE